MANNNLKYVRRIGGVKTFSEKYIGHVLSFREC